MNAETPLTPETQETQPRATPSRKPRVALMGEFSAGKSTLANVLLGTAPLPVQVTATRLPPVWISEGPDKATVVDASGQETPVSREDLATVPLKDAQVIRLSHQAPILELCDLIDMPGISDPNMPPSVWQALIAEVDHVIWCTHATQAWRQSEAAIWQSLADQIPGQSLLLVTQVDKLRTDRDRSRVLARLKKETRGLFSDVHPISLLEAEASGDDRDGWQNSGAGAVVEHLVEVLLSPAPRSEQPEPAIEPPIATNEDPPKPAPPAGEQRIIPRRIVRSANSARRHERPAAASGTRQEQEA